MIQNYNEAIEFLALYGNVSSNVDELKATKPTFRQIEIACQQAVRKYGMRVTDATDAMIWICRHHNIDIKNINAWDSKI